MDAVSEALHVTGGFPNSVVFERLIQQHPERVWQQARALPARVEQSRSKINSPPALLVRLIQRNEPLPTRPACYDIFREIEHGLEPRDVLQLRDEIERLGGHGQAWEIVKDMPASSTAETILAELDAAVIF